MIHTEDPEQSGSFLLLQIIRMSVEQTDLSLLYNIHKYLQIEREM